MVRLNFIPFRYSSLFSETWQISVIFKLSILELSRVLVTLFLPCIKKFLFCQRVQNSSYKINNSQGSNVQHGDYSELYGTAHGDAYLLVFAVHTNVGSLCCISETNMLYVK